MWKQVVTHGVRFSRAGSPLVRGLATANKINTIKKSSRSTTTTTATAATGASSAKTVSKPVTSTVVKGYSGTLTSALKGRQSIGTQQLESLDPSTDSAAAAPAANHTTHNNVDWYNSWFGLGTKPFDRTVQEVLLQELEAKDIEIKPDGLIYLPEIKYRRILNKAFGAGGWGLVPRSETTVTSSLVTREYGLICNGQLVGVARGEQDYFNENGIPTATEGCKSNALMRCCKDLGIGSELWDPVFIKAFKEQHCQEKFVEHVTTKKKKKIWLRKDRKVEYPYK